jgi:quinol monooxygenase YgiN
LRERGVIIVVGSVEARQGALEEVLRLSREHVDRSRLEPGCLRHSVHQDAENPNRLVFIEQWADRDALIVHFRVDASRTFAKAVGDLAAVRPTIEIYEAEPINL